MAKDIFPYGFHAGVRGHYPAQLIRAINARGFRAFVKVINDEGRALEALRIGDEHGLDNISVYRVTKRETPQGVFETEAPDYLIKKPIAEAAAEWWDNHMRFISDDLDRRIWIELANETNRNTYEWQGELYAEIAERFALPGGWRICVPGSNSGEPESWKGWERYFKLAALHPDRISVAIHYYAWGVGQTAHETWDDYYPSHVGRESLIYDICDELDIDYPIIHITEGGFTHDRLPSWEGHTEDFLNKMAHHVAIQPNMTGVGLWCAQEYQKNIHNEFVNIYVPKLIEMVNAWEPPETLARGARAKPKLAVKAAPKPATSTGQVTTPAKPRTAATGSLEGIVARRFGLGHDDHHNSFRVNTPVWFNFEFANTSGRDVPYGGLGVMSWWWKDGKWVLHRWQNSYGGFKDKLAAGQTLQWGDNIKLSEEGSFALALAITNDEGARDKVDRPGDISGLQFLLDPLYVKIGPHFIDGSALDKPPDGPPSELAPPPEEETPPQKPREVHPIDEPEKEAPAAARPRGKHQVIYLLAPQSLSRDERIQVYDLAWDGVEHAGGKTAGRHTVTFSHVDAFDAVRYGAPGSKVYIVEPQRIGTGITAEWMAENAPDVDFDLIQL